MAKKPNGDEPSQISEPTINIDGKELSTDSKIRISSKDLTALADEIQSVIDVDPSEITKDYIQECAKLLGPKIFKILFNDDPNVLAQRILQTPNTLKDNEVYRTYLWNWKQLIETLRDKTDYEWIRSSEKDWKGVKTLLRRMYRPFAVLKLAEKATDKSGNLVWTEAKAKERLPWDVLVALQTERFQIDAIKEALGTIFFNGAGMDKHEARSEVLKDATRIRTRNLMTKLHEQNKRVGVLDALEKRADRQTLLLRGIRYAEKTTKESAKKELEEMRTRINSALSQIDHVDQFMRNGNGDTKQETLKPTGNPWRVVKKNLEDKGINIPEGANRQVLQQAIIQAGYWTEQEKPARSSQSEVITNFLLASGYQVSHYIDKDDLQEAIYVAMGIEEAAESEPARTRTGITSVT